MQLLLKIESSISIGQNSADFPGAVGANAPIGQESPADAGIPARRKNDEKIPPFRSYNKFQSSRKSGVYSN